MTCALSDMTMSDKFIILAVLIELLSYYLISLGLIPAYDTDFMKFKLLSHEYSFLGTFLNFTTY